MKGFTITIVLEDGEEHVFDFPSVHNCLTDRPLYSLFEDDQIRECSISKDGARIAGVPIPTWERFKEQVRANAPKLMEGLYDDAPRDCQKEN